MTNFKKIKNSFTTMRNYLSIFLLLFVSLTFVNASNYISSSNLNQIDDINGFFATTPQVSSKMQSQINNNTLLNYITPVTKSGTLGLNYMLDTKVGLLLRNEGGETSNYEITIYSNEILEYAFNVTLPLNYNSWIIITPEQNEEQIKVTAQCVSGCSGFTAIYYKQYIKAQESLNSYITNIVDYVIQLVEINVSLWKLGFYMIIFAIGLFALLFLFFVAYKIYKATEPKENKRFKGGEE